MRETNWVRRERPGDRENKPSAVETLEEIAERIPRDWIDEARNGVAMSCVLLEQDKALLVNAILSALRNERERACRLLCPFCGHDGYNLIFHHEEWRHYRKTDNHVQYCQASILRGKDGNKDG